MRFKFAVPVLLAACLVSAVAIAASDKVVANFQSLQASGVTGEAVLKAAPQGGTLIHITLRGLEPNAIYSTSVFEGGQDCGAGPSTMIEQFEANPAGIAKINRKVAQDLVAIQSLSVVRVSDSQLQACAPVTQ